MVSRFAVASMASSAESAIVPNGNNVVAMHCNNTGGGQFVDGGIYLMTL
jgi:hypothetical protein